MRDDKRASRRRSIKNPKDKGSCEFCVCVCVGKRESEFENREIERGRKEEGNNNKNIEKYDEFVIKKRLKLMFFCPSFF